MRDFLVLAEPAVLYRPTLLATEVLTFCLVFIYVCFIIEVTDYLGI